jgi:predicted membrane-bound dolichyl-phosphate-mannose-protein mannosyltransferase
MLHPFESPVAPAILVSAISMALGCSFFRSRSLFVAFLNWFLAYFFLFVCAFDLFIEKTLWPSLAMLLAAAVCETVVLYYCIAPRRTSKVRKDSNARSPVGRRS